MKFFIINIFNEIVKTLLNLRSLYSSFPSYFLYYSSLSYFLCFLHPSFFSLIFFYFFLPFFFSLVSSLFLLFSSRIYLFSPSSQSSPFSYFLSISPTFFIYPTFSRRLFASTFTVKASAAKKKVLIVNINSGGHAVIRFYFAKELLSFGHKVTIMTVGD